jgi:hypothetical protein
VAKTSLDGIAFTPSTLSRAGNFDHLVLQATVSTSGLEPGGNYVAHVELKDGRQLDVPAVVEPPRPQVTLLSKGVQNDASAPPSPVTFGSPDDLPVEGRLVFFLRSDTPAEFPRDEKVEVAAADSSFHTTLELSDGSLMLEDANTAVGSLDPLARFGSSAFGPVRVRAVAADGVTGKWLPLGTLVRVPGFKDLRCPRSAAKPCILTGTDLFLANSIAATPDFDTPTDVPPVFTGTELSVPHPVHDMLYLKLRDDPNTVQTLTLPVTYTALPALPPAVKAHPAVTPPPAAAPVTQANAPATQPAAQTTPPAATTNAPATQSTAQAPAPSTPPAAAQATPPTKATPANATPSTAQAPPPDSAAPPVKEATKTTP